MRPLICMFAMLLMVRAAPVTSAAPVDDRKVAIKGWLHALSDPKSSVRADARRALMGISNDELPLLRQVIVAAGVLKPAEAEPLEGIVTYIRSRYLMLQHPRSGSAFLGVSLGSVSAEQADDDDRYDPIGVPIVDLLPGFVAYRFLEEGDVILSIGTGTNLRPTRTREELIAAVKSNPAGKVVTIRVLRGRAFVLVSFPLDGAIEGTPDEVRQLSDQAINDATRYWNEQFRPLIDRDPV